MDRTSQTSASAPPAEPPRHPSSSRGPARRLLEHLLTDADSLLHPPRSRQAALDPLLRIHTREAGVERLHREFARSCRRRTPLGVFVADIDHLSEINLRHGRETGDQVLVQTAHLMRSLLRRGDLLVRYGGEELMAVLPGSDLSVTRRVAERICARMADCAAPCEVSLSIGLSAYPECSSRSLDEFLRRVDSALAVAKCNGRNRVEAVH